MSVLYTMTYYSVTQIHVSLYIQYSYCYLHPQVTGVSELCVWYFWLSPLTHVLLTDSLAAVIRKGSINCCTLYICLTMSACNSSMSNVKAAFPVFPTDLESRGGILDAVDVTANVRTACSVWRDETDRQTVMCWCSSLTSEVDVDCEWWCGWYITLHYITFFNMA